MKGKTDSAHGCKNHSSTALCSLQLLSQLFVGHRHTWKCTSGSLHGGSKAVPLKQAPLYQGSHGKSEGNRCQLLLDTRRIFPGEDTGTE